MNIKIEISNVVINDNNLREAQRNDFERELVSALKRSLPSTLDGNTSSNVDVIKTEAQREHDSTSNLASCLAASIFHSARGSKGE